MNSFKFLRNLSCAFALAIVGIAGITYAAAASDVKRTAPRLDEFMAQKKVHSQAVLDGLMNENFESIIIAGEKMKVMRTDKRWNRIASENYQRFSQDFQKRAQALIDAAHKKNLDECMRSYIDCLQTCYDCHKYVRGYPYAKASFDPRDRSRGF